MNIFELLEKMKEHKASDLYLTVGLPPSYRNENIITDSETKLDNEMILSMLNQIASEEEQQQFFKNKELNTAIKDSSGERFRANFMYQQHNVAIIIRKINKIIPTIEELGLAPAYKEAIMQNRGLILVVGMSGSGKSTSIASMLDYRNTSGNGHIITIEDPIEYLHQHKNCIFTQREVGIDTNSWEEALKNALRQRPDVIYIGEIRDAVTMEQAMNFAETGHLCIATLHATNASTAIERITNLFPISAKQQSLYSLAQVLKYVFAQRLVMSREGKRVAAIEILRNVGLMKPLIIDGKIPEIKDLMNKNSDIGMMTFENCLQTMFHNKIISEEVAVNEADNPDEMRLALFKNKLKFTTDKPLPNKTMF